MGLSKFGGDSIHFLIRLSDQAPMSLPATNMFSGYTSTPFMPAPYYNPSTFGAPTTAFSGMLCWQ